MARNPEYVHGDLPNRQIEYLKYLYGGDGKGNIDYSRHNAVASHLYAKVCLYLIEENKRLKKRVDALEGVR